MELDEHVLIATKLPQPGCSMQYEEYGIVEILSARCQVDGEQKYEQHRYFG